MTERAQALEAAIEKARRGLIGFAAEIQDGRVPVVGAVRDHLVLNLGLIASFLADALEGSQPPPPVGSPTTKRCDVCGEPAIREFCYAAEPWVPYCGLHCPQYATVGERELTVSLPLPAPVSPVEPTPEPPQDGGNPK